MKLTSLFAAVAVATLPLGASAAVLNQLDITGSVNPSTSVYSPTGQRRFPRKRHGEDRDRPVLLGRHDRRSSRRARLQPDHLRVCSTSASPRRASSTRAAGSRSRRPRSVISTTRSRAVASMRSGRSAGLRQHSCRALAQLAGDVSGSGSRVVLVHDDRVARPAAGICSDAADGNRRPGRHGLPVASPEDAGCVSRHDPKPPTRRRSLTEMARGEPRFAAGHFRLRPAPGGVCPPGQAGRRRAVALRRHRRVAATSVTCPRTISPKREPSLSRRYLQENRPSGEGGLPCPMRESTQIGGSSRQSVRGSRAAGRSIRSAIGEGYQKVYTVAGRSFTCARCSAAGGAERRATAGAASWTARATPQVTAGGVAAGREAFPRLATVGRLEGRRGRSARR